MIRRVAVVVPACNEEQRVGRCIASVAAAIAAACTTARAMGAPSQTAPGAVPAVPTGSEPAPPGDDAAVPPADSELSSPGGPDGPDGPDAPDGPDGPDAPVVSAPLHVTVVLAADACTDRTVDRARAAWAASGLPEGTARLEVVTGSWRSAGGARAAAASWALANCRPEWIASTDADTAVPENWGADQLEHAAHGVDAVLGTVEPDPAECPVAVYRLWQREHTLAEGHPHIHAANMGVRARSYERAGGFPALECSEDEALVAALHRVGARIEATDRIRAITSARFEGRAELGFAHHLLGLAQLAGQPEEAPWPGSGQSQRPEPAGRPNGPEFFAHRKNA